MKRKIKLIWDFRGQDAHKTAEHHCTHLIEFTTIKDLEFHEVEAAEISDYHSIAYIIVDEKDMIIYRDSVKPHRAEVAK